ncbi:MAG TPA: HAD family hydrolase [Dehalococcoidia bacterium]|nr:HAD family hydrolase [Dehalococcoidia bacterium]
MREAADDRPVGPPRAILFDLDGTLDDRSRSIARYARPFQASFAEHLAEIEIAELEALLQRADGDGYRVRADVCEDLLRVLPWQNAPEVQQLVEHWYAWFPISAAPRDGLEALLPALARRGIRLGVVSNGGVRIQRAKLAALGIERYFSAVVISEAVGIEKPDPAIFRHALDQLGCAAGEAWFVGDHPVNDVLGASAAGLWGIWLPALHPWPAEHPPPAWQIATLLDILRLLEPAAFESTGPTASHIAT